MIHNALNNDEIHSRAWIEVFRRCGNEKRYAKLMKTPQPTVNGWRNKPGIKVPMIKLMETEMLTGVLIEKLNPFFPEDNKIMRRWQENRKNLHIREMFLNDIVIEKMRYLPLLQEDERILVDNKGVLISGLTQIEAHKKNHKNKVRVFVVDIEALVLELCTINEIGDFSKSELICIGYRIKQLIGSRKGKPIHSLSRESEKDGININKPSIDRTVRYELKWAGLTNAHLAKILGFSGKNTYYRTEKVCEQGTPSLINALNEGLVSIHKAFEISNLPKDKQNEVVLQLVLVKTKLSTQEEQDGE